MPETQVEFTPIKEVFKIEEGKKVTIRGWVYRRRRSDKLQFFLIRDSTGVIQTVVVKDDVSNDVWDNAEKLYIESSVIISGKVRNDNRAPGGKEVSVTDVKPVCIGEPFKISKDFSTEFLLDNRHLWLRSQRMTNILKARHVISMYIREFFDSRGFYEVVPPIIVKNACEGGSQMFKIDYFGEDAYLSESGQLYGEALIYSLEKIYVWAPSFRAEKSRTVRHLAEYWHVEPEMAWYHHEDNIRLQEELIEYVVQKFVKEHSDILEALGRDPEVLKKVKRPFERITYEEMVNRLQDMGLKFEWGDDPGADEEKALTKDLDKPLVVERYPRGTKAFYMRVDPDNPKYVLNDDILAPEGHGEIIGGSERIWQYDELIESMKLFNLNPDDPAYSWYVDLRRYGSVPHSGFGLGLERFIKWIFNLDHIRDAIPFPRTINRVYP